jgi:beta-1,2-mannosidase
MNKILLTFLILIFSCNGSEDKVAEKPQTDNWMLLPFDKQEKFFPVLKTDTSSFFCPVTKRMVRWQESYVFNPAAIVRNGRVYLLYRGEDTIGRFGGTSRIGIAESDDGFHFKMNSLPVLFPDNDAFLEFEKDGGCEDPRIVESPEGKYIMTYTAFNGSLARLCIASSDDLYHWEKRGLAFGKAGNGKYKDLWSKSGAIVCKQTNGKLTATKINGKYWMYWGETDIYLATSENLVDWEPVLKEEKTGKRFAGYSRKEGYDIRFDTPRYFFKTAVSIREGRFDSELVEPGPTPIITAKGIFFIYNASNSGTKGDTSLVPGEYSVGQVLFDSKDPASVIRRCENPFLRAEGKNEITGQMNNTAFVEALINHNGKWIIYYVMGEAGIGVATCDKTFN